MLKKISKMFHVHLWSSSCSNMYGKPAERKCRCGQYQHLKGFDEMWGSKWYDFSSPFGFDSVKWREGEHPIAADLRATGRSSNY